MTRLNLSRSLLSGLLITGTVASFILDWRENHLLNPAWHPHARFHGGLLLFTLAGISTTALWLLWRTSREPLVAIRAATFLLLASWTPLFYVNSLVPAHRLGGTDWPGTTLGRNHHLPESDRRRYFRSARGHGTVRGTEGADTKFRRRGRSNQLNRRVDTKCRRRL